MTVLQNQIKVMTKMIHETAKLYGNSKIGENPIILENVCIGYPSRNVLREISDNKISLDESKHKGAVIGRNAVIRSNSIIYCKVTIGNDFQTGHNILIREDTMMGDSVLVGTNAVVENKCRIGSHVSIQSGAYLPTNTTIEDHVFIGPSSTLTNDRYPIRVKEGELAGPVVRKGASIGASAVLLPGIEVGEGAMVAAGAIVTRDVPPWHLAKGTPAKITELPEKLRVLNKI